jgi:hypothetical protein
MAWRRWPAQPGASGKRSRPLFHVNHDRKTARVLPVSSACRPYASTRTRDLGQRSRGRNQAKGNE